MGLSPPGVLSPCSVLTLANQPMAMPLARVQTVMALKKVLILNDKWLARVLGPRCAEDTAVFRECAKRLRGTEEYRVLGRFLDENPENRVIYLGDDGILARVFGDRVLDLYGSRTRLRCRKCGHRWWIDQGQQCPHCSSTSYEPDYTPPGERPPQKKILEALYEVTSSDEAYFVEPRNPPELIELLLLIIALKFTDKVTVIGEPLSHLRNLVRIENSLTSILENNE